MAVKIDECCREVSYTTKLLFKGCCREVADVQRCNIQQKCTLGYQTNKCYSEVAIHDKVNYIANLHFKVSDQWLLQGR